MDVALPYDTDTCETLVVVAADEDVVDVFGLLLVVVGKVEVGPLLLQLLLRQHDWVATLQQSKGNELGNAKIIQI